MFWLVETFFAFPVPNQLTVDQRNYKRHDERVGVDLVKMEALLELIQVKLILYF